MNNDDSIDLLNTLIDINNDKIKVYEMALKKTEETHLRDSFNKVISTSQKYKAELLNKMRQLSGKLEEEPKKLVKLSIIWQVMKARMTGGNPVVILNRSEYGEEVTNDAYKGTLGNAFEKSVWAQEKMFNEHNLLMKSDFNRVKGVQENA